VPEDDDEIEAALQRIRRDRDRVRRWTQQRRSTHERVSVWLPAALVAAVGRPVSSERLSELVAAGLGVPSTDAAGTGAASAALPPSSASSASSSPASPSGPSPASILAGIAVPPGLSGEAPDTLLRACAEAALAMRCVLLAKPKAVLDADAAVHPLVVEGGFRPAPERGPGFYAAAMPFLAASAFAERAAAEPGWSLWIRPTDPPPED